MNPMTPHRSSHRLHISSTILKQTWSRRNVLILLACHFLLSTVSYNSHQRSIFGGVVEAADGRRRQQGQQRQQQQQQWGNGSNRRNQQQQQQQQQHGSGRQNKQSSQQQRRQKQQQQGNHQQNQTNDPKKFYQVLNVSTNSSPKEIKSAYRKLALKYHVSVINSQVVIHMYAYVVHLISLIS